jgi:hypothetical protein
MKYIITNKQYNLILESSEEEKLLNVPDFSFFANDWNILQLYLKSEGNPRYYVDGNLNLQNLDIKSLGNLVGVEGNLNLWASKIESLENLEFVGGYLYLINSRIKSLGNLEYVGGNLYLGNTLLPRITTKDEIRSKVNVVGNILFT